MYNVCTPGKRIVAAIIDYVSLSIITSIFSLVFFGSQMLTASQEVAEVTDPMEIISTAFENNLGSSILSLGFVLLYFCIIPLFFKGQTIGRHLTKTKVLTESFEEPTFGTLLLRDLIGAQIITSILIACCCAGLVINMVLLFGEKNTIIADIIGKTKLVDLETFVEPSDEEAPNVDVIL